MKEKLFFFKLQSLHFYARKKCILGPLIVLEDGFNEATEEFLLLNFLLWWSFSRDQWRISNRFKFIAHVDSLLPYTHTEHAHTHPDAQTLSYCWLIGHRCWVVWSFSLRSPCARRDVSAPANACVRTCRFTHVYHGLINHPPIYSSCKGCVPQVACNAAAPHPHISTCSPLFPSYAVPLLLYFIIFKLFRPSKRLPAEIFCSIAAALFSLSALISSSYTTTPRAFFPPAPRSLAFIGVEDI